MRHRQHGDDNVKLRAWSWLLAFCVFLPAAAQADKSKIPYSAAAVDEARAKGCAVLLEFGASW